MPIDVPQLIATGFVLLFSAATQSAAGFGMGLIATPLLVWLGWPLPQAVAVATVGSAIQMGVNGFQLREHVLLKKAALITILRTVTVPLGTWMLTLLALKSQGTIKQVIGGFIILAVVLQYVGRVKPREVIAIGWTISAGVSSGIMNGLIGMGGPPTILWVMAHQWTSLQQRATMFFILFVGSVMSVIMLVLAFGAPLLRAAVIGGCMTPVILLGAAVGMRLGAKMNSTDLRRVATIMLILLAISSIVQPMLGD